MKGWRIYHKYKNDTQVAKFWFIMEKTGLSFPTKTRLLESICETLL